MFIDKAKILIKAGNGGNGAIAFHREKYVAAGGPDGGDGGKGGNVIFRVDLGLTTLMDFRYKRKYVAESGEQGRKSRMNGKNGANIIINVPQGTVVRDVETNKIIADIYEPDKDYILAKGGNGGWGNAHFATATRQTPNFAKNGQKGDEREVYLELKLLADVGLVGFPNVGKSTILSRTTKADPKIANYHFTTLEPNLGVVSVDEHMNFVLADIPGIIEGASEGVGLGHEFLRHIERTRLLIHVVDVSGIEGRNPIEDFDIINNELVMYNMELENRPQIIAANKTDIIQDQEVYQSFLDEMDKRGYKVFPISAATNQGVAELMKYTYTELQKLPPIQEFDIELDVNEVEFIDKTDKGFEITKEDGVYVVSGSWIEAVGGSVNFADEDSLQFFQYAIKNRGVIDALVEEGIKEGDTVRIGDLEFDFVL
ncbi:MAG: GTPase ObgE [Ruminococcaceae bacterium]|nr:GTPase ObgE [Oscillospiraceae bacterium]